MMTTDLTILAPLINPWNGVVALATLLVIEVVKSSFPHHFINGHAGNRWLRPLCVVGCAVGYQIDGPWITGDMDPWLRLFVGGLIGAETTIGYAAARAAVKKVTAQTQENVLKAIKKWVAVLGALAAAISGVYGAWFKPETKAREGYVITVEAVGALGADVAKLADAHTALDKDVSVELAKLIQRLDNLEDMAKTRYAYEPEPTVVIEESMGDFKPMTRPKPMPAAQEIFGQ